MSPLAPPTSRPPSRALLVILAAAGCGDDVPPPAPDAAPVGALAHAVAALGGPAALAVAIEEIEATGRRYEPGEGLLPEQPLLMSDFTVARAATATGPQHRQALVIDARAVLPQRVEFTETIDDRVGYVDGVDNIFGAESPQTPLFPPRVAGQLRHTDLMSPLRLVRRALATPAAVRELPDVEVDGRRQQVVGLTLDGAPEIRLHVDAATGLPSRAITLEDHPPVGDREVEVRYADYRATDGVQAPFAVTVAIEGQLVHQETRQAVRGLAAADPARFAVPAGFQVPDDEAAAARARRSSQWYAGFFHGAFSFFYFDQAGSEVEDVVLAPGVRYLRGPSHHNLLVEQADGLVIVDAPMYVERTAAVRAHVAQVYPGKPLRHVVATHFHQDHCGGIRELVADGGATVYAGAPTRAYFEEIFTNPHTVAPDRLARNPVPVTVTSVDRALTLPDPARPVALYRIPNSHAEDMLIVYLPQQKLLFVADLFGPNPALAGQELPGDYKRWAAELYAAVVALGLDVETVVGAHGDGTATLEDVRRGGGVAAP